MSGKVRWKYVCPVKVGGSMYVRLSSGRSMYVR